MIYCAKTLPMLADPAEPDSLGPDSLGPDSLGPDSLGPDSADPGPHPDLTGRAGNPKSHGVTGHGTAGHGITSIYGVTMASAAVMLLALGGCGHEKYGDTYPVTSAVVVEGGDVVGGKDSAANSGGQNTGGEAAQEQTGTILFMASPGGGKPPRLIARTNSITSVPTTEFLAREAIAAEQRAPDAGNRLVPPLVVTEDGNQANPIAQPADVYGTPTGSPNGAPTSTPTILKIIQAP